MEELLFYEKELGKGYMKRLKIELPNTQEIDDFLFWLLDYILAQLRSFEEQYGTAKMLQILHSLILLLQHYYIERKVDLRTKQRLLQ